MVTEEQARPPEVDASQLGALELGDFEVPYIDLEEWPSVGTELVVDGTAYMYTRSFPIQGHSAVMPGAVRELLAQGKRVLVAERTERYYVYVA